MDRYSCSWTNYVCCFTLLTLVLSVEGEYKNVALKRLGTTCSNSSSYPTYSCEGAIDGNYGFGPDNEWASHGEGVGAWIELDFPQQYWITRVKVQGRTSTCAHGGNCPKRVRIKFDNEETEINIPQKTSYEGNLPTPQWTRKVRLTVLQFWGVTRNNVGLEEVEMYTCSPDYYGNNCSSQCNCINPEAGCHPVSGVTQQCVCKRGYYKDTERCQMLYGEYKNVALGRFGTTCSNSSSYPGYSCEGAIDGNYGFGSDNEWASHGEGVGAWIELHFTQQYWITRVKIQGRSSSCAVHSNGDCPKRVKIKFDNSASEVDTPRATFYEGNLPTPQWTTTARLTVLEFWGTIKNVGFKEVEMYTCAPDYYGNNCSRQCNCINPAAGCHPVHGYTQQCVCKPGYYKDTDRCRIITVQMTNEAVNKGQPGQVTCTAIGDPRPSDITLSTNATHVTVSEFESKEIGTYSLQKVFMVSELDTATNLVCTATNNRGGRNDVQNVSKVNVQPQLNNLVTLQAYVTSIEVSWIPWDTGQGGDGPIEKYTVYWKKSEHSGISGQWLQKEVGPYHNRYTITRLTPNIKYDVALSAARPGAGGEGSMSPVTAVKTKCDVPERVVVFIGQCRRTSPANDDAQITWKYPLTGINCDYVKGHTIHVFSDNKKFSYQYSSNATTGTVPGLERNFTYNITISYTNSDALESGESEVLQCRINERPSTTTGPTQGQNVVAIIVPVGGVVCLLIIIGLVLIICKRRRSPENEQEVTESVQSENKGNLDYVNVRDNPAFTDNTHQPTDPPEQEPEYMSIDNNDIEPTPNSPYNQLHEK